MNEAEIKANQQKRALEKINEDAGKDKAIADGMRSYWMHKADGAEPFVGGED